MTGASYTHATTNTVLVSLLPSPIASVSRAEVSVHEHPVLGVLTYLNEAPVGHDWPVLDTTVERRAPLSKKLPRVRFRVAKQGREGKHQVKMGITLF